MRALVMRFLLPFLAVAFCSCSTQSTRGPASSIEWFRGSLEAALSEAQSEGRHIFLYWGATWCDACQDIEASILKRRDVAAELRSFIPLRVTNDSGMASRIQEELHLSDGTYPVLVVLNADRAEIARLPHTMERHIYAGVLADAAASVTPVRSLLNSLMETEVGSTNEPTYALPNSDATIPRSKSGTSSPLSHSSCRRIAYNHWAADPLMTPNEEAMLRLSKAAALAANLCPHALATERARLISLAVKMRSAMESRAVKRGSPTSATMTELLDQISEFLTDPAFARSIADSLAVLSPNFFSVARARGSQFGEQLLQRWVATMDLAATYPRYSPGTRVSFLASELTAAEGLHPERSIPMSLWSSAISRAEAILRETHDQYARAFVISGVVGLYQKLGRPEQARAVVESEMSNSPSPSMYMNALMYFDEQLGRTAAALEWARRSYEEAEGSMTRFRRGVTYLSRLMKASDTSPEVIESTVLSLIGEIRGSNDLYGDTGARMAILGSLVLAWSKAAQREHFAYTAQARLNEICGSAAATLAPCSAFSPTSN